MEFYMCERCHQDIPVNNRLLHQARCRVALPVAEKVGAADDNMEKPASAPSVPPAQDNQDNRDNQDNQEGWYCPKCTFLNSLRSPSCSVCDASRDIQEVHAAPEIVVPNDMIACDKCTFHNAIGAQRCEICGERLGNDDNNNGMNMDDDVRAPDESRRERLVGSNNNNPLEELLSGFSGAGAPFETQNTNQRRSDEFQEAANRHHEQNNRVFTTTVMGGVLGAMNAFMNDESIARGAITGGSLGFVGSNFVNAVQNNTGTTNPLPPFARGGGENSRGLRDFMNMNIEDDFTSMLRWVMRHSGHRGDNLDVDNMSYEELLDRFGTGSNTRRADTRTIQSMPTHSHEGGSVEEKTCNICLEDFKNGETIKVLPCGHDYHSDCIDRWLKNVNNCPICKKSI